MVEANVECLKKIPTEVNQGNVSFVLVSGMKTCRKISQ